MSVAYYARLLADTARIDGFRRAIERTVGKGDRVLEIGTGVGTYAFFAARAGAGRVVAVDHSPVVHVAETLAVANGLADRIEFVRGRVEEIALEGAYDVLVYEDFPTTLLDRSSREMLARVQETALADGARMVPAAARLVVAPVQSEAIHDLVLPAPLGPDGAYGLDLTPLRSLAAATGRRMTLDPDVLLGEPFRGPRLALLPVPDARALAVEAVWDASTAGTVHAVALWFDLEISAGDWLSNRPGPDAGPWGQWVLPVEPPLEVAEGERLEVSVAREDAGRGAPGWLRWELRAGDEVRRGHELGGALLAPEALAAEAVDDPDPSAGGNAPSSGRVSTSEPARHTAREPKT